MLTILIHIFITFNLIIFLLNKNRKCQCSTVSSVDRKYPEHQKLEGLLPLFSAARAWRYLTRIIQPPRVPLIYQQSSEKSQES